MRSAERFLSTPSARLSLHRAARGLLEQLQQSAGLVQGMIQDLAARTTDTTLHPVVGGASVIVFREIQLNTIDIFFTAKHLTVFGLFRIAFSKRKKRKYFVSSSR